jgi:outer membrane protein assembly factor BamB
MKHFLLMIGMVTLVVVAGCKTTPNGINQTSKAKIGTPIWEFETGIAVQSSPAIGSDGTVYIGSWDKKFYAINGKSGVKLWEFETGSLVDFSPAIGSDGTVYVGSKDKKLYAINGKSGLKLWEFEARGTWEIIATTV